MPLPVSPDPFAIVVAFLNPASHASFAATCSQWAAFLQFRDAWARLPILQGSSTTSLRAAAGRGVAPARLRLALWHVARAINVPPPPLWPDASLTSVSMEELHRQAYERPTACCFEELVGILKSTIFSDVLPEIDHTCTFALILVFHLLSGVARYVDNLSSHDSDSRPVFMTYVCADLLFKWREERRAAGGPDAADVMVPLCLELCHVVDALFLQGAPWTAFPMIASEGRSGQLFHFTSLCLQHKLAGDADRGLVERRWQIAADAMVGHMDQAGAVVTYGGNCEQNYNIASQILQQVWDWRHGYRPSGEGRQ